MDLPTFLAWFEGFAENIDEAPTEKQWGRIKERIKQLQSAPAGYPFPPPPEQAEAPAKIVAKPKTPSEWLDQYVTKLNNLGVDNETAADFASDLPKPVDMSLDPSEVAEKAVAEMMA